MCQRGLPKSGNPPSKRLAAYSSQTVFICPILPFPPYIKEPNRVFDAANSIAHCAIPPSTNSLFSKRRFWFHFIQRLFTHQKESNHQSQSLDICQDSVIAAPSSTADSSSDRQELFPVWLLWHLSIPQLSVKFLAFFWHLPSTQKTIPLRSLHNSLVPFSSDKVFTPPYLSYRTPFRLDSMPNKGGLFIFIAIW